MEEARFSVNIRFSVDGYDSQLSIRGNDESTLQADFGRAMTFLERNHCTPERRWEATKNGHGNGNGNGTPKPAAVTTPAAPVPPPPAPIAQPKPTNTLPAKPLCKKCNTNAGMELIEFTDKKTGEPKAAWKCQTCMTWVR